MKIKLAIASILSIFALAGCSTGYGSTFFHHHTKVVHVVHHVVVHHVVHRTVHRSVRSHH